MNGRRGGVSLLRLLIGFGPLSDEWADVAATSVALRLRRRANWILPGIFLIFATVLPSSLTAPPTRVFGGFSQHATPRGLWEFIFWWPATFGALLVPWAVAEVVVLRRERAALLGELLLTPIHPLHFFALQTTPVLAQLAVLAVLQVLAHITIATSHLFATAQPTASPTPGDALWLWLAVAPAAVATAWALVLIYRFAFHSVTWKFCSPLGGDYSGLLIILGAAFAAPVVGWLLILAPAVCFEMFPRETINRGMGDTFPLHADYLHFLVKSCIPAAGGALIIVVLLEGLERRRADKITKVYGEQLDHDRTW